MNPDLKKYKATNLEIQVDLDIPSDIAIKLRKYSSPDEQGDSFFTAKHHRHRVWLWMISQKEKQQNDRERYQMHYFCKFGRTSRRISASIEGLFDLLSPVIDKVNLHTSADFLYTKEVKAKPIIEVPNKYINDPNVPFDYIQGYHFIKKSTELGKGYNVVLDSNKRGEYFVRVIFEHSEKFDKELFNDCVKEAESIARKFIIF